MHTLMAWKGWVAPLLQPQRKAFFNYKPSTPPELFVTSGLGFRHAGATHATGLLTVAPEGLAPPEHACLLLDALLCENPADGGSTPGCESRVHYRRMTGFVHPTGLSADTGGQRLCTPK